MRHLTSAEIETLASRDGVNRKAVTRFLETMELNHDAAMASLKLEAGVNRWKLPTCGAILGGIRLANK